MNCIIHTHPAHVAALSMLEQPLVVSHMDTCPLYDDCAFLKDWPGVPVGNEEGEIISKALGSKRAILLSHHGQLVVGKTIEEACILALLIERAAKLQLLAMAAGEIAGAAGAGARSARLDLRRSAMRSRSTTTRAGHCGRIRIASHERAIRRSCPRSSLRNTYRVHLAERHHCLSGYAVLR